MTVNCSAHWFDEQGGLLAQGWYDQGVRDLAAAKPWGRASKRWGFACPLPLT